MSRALAILTFSLAAWSLCAQTGTAPAAPAGMETPWAIAPMFQELSDHAGRLLAELNKINSNAWVEKGASETYGEQLQSCKAQAQALSDGAKALARNPEQLAASLELFFRIQALESMLLSVEEAMRKYDTPSAAQSLAALEAEAAPNRDRLQRYIVSLAADREQQLKITDKEAQRCRALLTAPPPATAKTGKKK
jgi:hypothetical protein